MKETEEDDLSPNYTGQEHLEALDMEKAEKKAMEKKENVKEVLEEEAKEEEDAKTDDKDNADGKIMADDKDKANGKVKEVEEKEEEDVNVDDMATSANKRNITYEGVPIKIPPTPPKRKKIRRSNRKDKDY